MRPRASGDPESWLRRLRTSLGRLANAVSLLPPRAGAFCTRFPAECTTRRLAMVVEAQTVPHERPHLPFDAASASTSTGRSAPSKCPYCDFNSHVRHAPVDQARFVARLPRARSRTMAALAPGRTVTSDLLRRRHAVADGARDRRRRSSTPSARTGRVAPDVEITLEANPTSVEAARFRGYRAAGRQPRLARRAGAQRRRPAARSAACTPSRRRWRRSRSRASIFDALLLRPDLCPARPDAGRLGGRARSRRSAAPAEHLSLYQLTIEPGTVFERLHEPASSPCRTTTRRARCST